MQGPLPATYFTFNMGYVNRPIQEIHLNDPLTNTMIAGSSRFFGTGGRPATPTGFQLSTTSVPTSLTVRWNTVPGVQGYKIYYGNQGPGIYNGPTGGSSGPPSPVYIYDPYATYYDMTGLTSGVTYHVAIVAFDYSGTESDYSFDLFATPGVGSGGGTAGGTTGTSGGLLDIIESFAGVPNTLAPGNSGTVFLNVKNNSGASFNVRALSGFQLNNISQPGMPPLTTANMSWTPINPLVSPLSIAPFSQIPVSINVTVPAGHPDGEHEGFLTLFNDSNSNGILDPTEPSDTVTIDVGVLNSQGTISISPNPPVTNSSLTITYTSNSSRSTAPVAQVEFTDFTTQLVSLSGPLPGTSFSGSFTPTKSIDEITVWNDTASIGMGPPLAVKFVGGAAGGGGGSGQLNILSTVVDLGSVAAGTTSAFVGFSVQNTSSVDPLDPVRKIVPASLTSAVGSISGSALAFSDVPVIAPATSGNWLVQVNVPSGQPAGTYTGTLTLYEDQNFTFVNDPNEPSDTITVQVTVTGGGGGSFSPSVTLGSTNASAVTTATVTFTTTQNIPFDGKVRVTFPAGFNVTSITGASWNQEGGFSAPTFSGQTVTFQRSAVSVLNAPASVSMSILNVTNPSAPGATGSYLVETTDPSNVVRDSGSASGTTITSGGGGSLTGVDVQPASLAAGASGLVTVSFDSL